jgi:hypothetical protein
LRAIAVSDRAFAITQVPIAAIRNQEPQDNQKGEAA